MAKYATSPGTKFLSTDTDEVIHEALALVNLSSQYPVDASGLVAELAPKNKSTISDFRLIFYKALFLVLRNSSSQYVKKQVELKQDTSLEAGWARVPEDYIAQDPNTQVPYEMRTDNDEGRIVKGAGSTISYIFIPLYLKDLPYSILHCVQTMFLSLCIGRDDTFAKKAPMIREMYQTADSLMRTELSGESGRNYRAGNFI